MKVYYITQDNGDGSTSVLFFRNKDTPTRLVDEDHDPEAYWGNEGEVSEFEIPDGPNTIRFRD